jgi:cobalt-zinc-cadmium efflux system outer membrane protein
VVSCAAVLRGLRHPSATLRSRHVATLSLIVLALVSAPELLPAQPAPSTPPAASLTLDEALSLAATANRSLIAARRNLDVSRAGIPVASARPNPDLTYEDQREGPHDALGLSLPIETAKKRSHRIAVAQAGVAATEAELARSALDVRSKVRRAFFALVAAQERITEIAELETFAQ